MRFTKMHGTGNDFVLIDALDARAAEAHDWPSFARRVCDRHFGVGADGILLVQRSDVADFRMQMFNPDGSEAEMCGNGIRCFGKYLFERGLTSKRELRVETGAGVLALALLGEGGRVDRVRVSMGVPILYGPRIPVQVEREPVVDYPLEVAGRTIPVTCVSMGNPHAVAFLDEPVSEYPLEAIGPKVEHHPLFPRRVNFEIARVVAPGVVETRVWERGAGITLACGTGACAVAVAARLQGLTNGAAEVRLPGGSLELSWDGHGEVLMAGPAEFVFEGQLLLGL